MICQLMRNSCHCVDPSHGDRHLTASGKEVVDEGIPLRPVEEDIDRQPRRTSPTLGADEKEPG
jgi:hypothetical protein